MKKLLKKLLCVILATTLTLAVGIGFAGCNDGNQLTPEQIEQILEARRDKVEQYMRKQVSIVWKAGANITYSIDSGNKTFNIVEGQYYLGMPYSYGGKSLSTFQDWLSEPDEKGVATLQLTDDDVDAQGNNFGNDCSSAVCLAWGTINASIKDGSENTRYMSVNNGYLRVGDYESDPTTIEGTKSVCMENGRETMFKAYAQLKKSDVVISRNGSGHVRLIVSTEVKYKPDGSIDPYLSKIVCLEQTRSLFGQVYYNEELGEDLNYIGGVDVSYTFDRLFQDGYVPITCKELRDASDIPEENTTDSIKNPSIDDLFTGTITSEYMMEKVKVEICDANSTVQSLSKNVKRYSYYKFEMNDFVAGESLMKGEIDISALESGEYTCKVTAYLVTGKEAIIRNFNFTK